MVVVLSERGEHVARPPQDEQRPLPPQSLHVGELRREADRLVDTRQPVGHVERQLVAVHLDLERDQPADEQVRPIGDEERCARILEMVAELLQAGGAPAFWPRLERRSGP